MFLEQRLSELAVRIGQQIKIERLAHLAKFGNLNAMPTVDKTVAGAIAELYAQATGPIAANRLTGMIRPENLPVQQVLKIHKSTANSIAELSQADQDALTTDGVNGTCNAIRLGNGLLLTYDGGTKTDIASFTPLADYTPDWELITGKPLRFVSTIALVDGLEAALGGLQANINDLGQTVAGNRTLAQNALAALEQTVAGNRTLAEDADADLMQLLTGHELSIQELLAAKLAQQEALSKTVRFDAQSLTSAQKAQALANIGAQPEVTNLNLIALFEAEL